MPRNFHASLLRPAFSHPCCTFLVALLAISQPLLTAADVPAKPVLKITPGQVIVPTDAMRRIWGELVSVDLTTRTGTFRKEGTDELMSFTVLPYAELLHHAAFGDLQDFRIGERAIFRMHENASGEWTWLTYIQDQMNMMNGHKEYFYVDSIAADKGQLTCTQANADMSFVREKGILIETDKDTRYSKNGQPATFADIKVGDKLRTKTHGVGKGKVQMCWEVFLDDESLLKFQTEQKAVHAQRLKEEGAPGYVDKLSEKELQLTLFQESGEVSRALKTGQKVRVAPAGADRKATSAPVSGTVTEAKMAGNLGRVMVTLDAASGTFRVGDVMRLWP
ncbi:hypothetical protein BH11VER1_BH11VER1_09300 [soil metagenome]